VWLGPARCFSTVSVRISDGLLPSAYLCFILFRMPEVKKNNIKRKTGRPPLGEKPSEFVGLRISGEMIKSIDRWGKQNGRMQRSEAIRRLIERGLEEA
jgi:hypothetical protein